MRSDKGKNTFKVFSLHFLSSVTVHPALVSLKVRTVFLTEGVNPHAFPISFHISLF